MTTYADATGAGLSRGQTDANHFGYTLAATVEGAAFTTQAVGGSRVRLTITPSASYTIWFAAATPAQRARQRLGDRRPKTLLGSDEDRRLRGHAHRLRELVARVLGQVVRAVLEQRGRRRLPGERLLPVDVHDRGGRVRQIPVPLHQRRLPGDRRTTPSGATPTGTGTSATSTTRSWRPTTPT